MRFQVLGLVLSCHFRSLLSLSITSRRMFDLKPLIVNRLDAAFTQTPQRIENVCLVSNAFFQNESARELWSSKLFEKCRNIIVSCQTKEAGYVYCDDVGFEDFLQRCFRSSHNKSVFLLDEDLLSSLCDLGFIFKNLPKSLWPEGDHFDVWPSGVRPKKPCLIMGGAGARSSLHADPMTWTGWNYLVEGSKIWTFFAPFRQDGEEVSIDDVLMVIQIFCKIF